MRIGILGPTRVKEFCERLGVEESEYLYFLEKIAERLASTSHEIIVMPASGTAQGLIASAYKDLGGKKVVGIVPRDDTEWGIRDVDETIADDIINCGTWRNQPEKFCEESDVLLVVGLAPGAMIEICYTKWFKVKRVFLMRDFMSQKLHPEIEKDIPVEYISIQDLKDKIK